MQEVRTPESASRLGECLDRHRIPRGEHLVVCCGAGRSSLASKRTRRASARSEPAGSAPSRSHSTFVPSQLPACVAPKASAASSPISTTSSSHDHAKNFPSTPSESASWLEKKPPSGCRISRMRYSSVSPPPPVAIAPSSRAMPGCTPARAARCRRASSRSAGRATRVDAVAREAAAELVVDAAARPSRSSVVRDHVSARDSPVRRRSSAEQELERHRVRELRRPAEAAATGVEARRERLERRARARSATARRARRARRRRRAASSDAAGPALDDLPRRSRQASATRLAGPARKDGMPVQRSSGGKYVPPKNGCPSGVRNTVIGQPPLPGQSTCTAFM